MEGTARTHPDILKVVLGPYMQYCPCEASEQKLGQKPETELRVIEFSYCHHSICLKKTSIRKKIMSKLDEKLPSYAQFNVLVPKWNLAYFVPIDGNFGKFVRYELSNSSFKGSMAIFEVFGCLRL